MRYEREDGSASFELPDEMTVRQQLAFRGKLSEAAEGGVFVRYWNAAPSIMTNWQCALIPDPAALDLDMDGDAQTVDIVAWVGNTIAGHMAALETPPKN